MDIDKFRLRIDIFLNAMDKFFFERDKLNLAIDKLKIEIDKLSNAIDKKALSKKSIKKRARKHWYGLNGNNSLKRITFKLSAAKTS